MSNLPHLHDTILLLPYSAETLPPHLLYPDTPSHDRLLEREKCARQAQILLIGDHPTLQYSRCKILESAGYTVKSMKSTVIVEELFLRDIGLVLLCHTIPENMATRIVTAFTRIAPQIPVLRISPLNNWNAGREMLASVPTLPAAFLGAVAATLSHR